jgi:hypothetical protein
VQEFLSGPFGKGFEQPIQWFYDPMAVPAFAGQMGEILTVYDSMDELSKFRGPPPEITDREVALLERADIVFTSGRLFESNSQFHENCHFYGCGVDWEHFGKARAAQTVVPQELSSLSEPVLGYPCAWRRYAKSSTFLISKSNTAFLGIRSSSWFR